MVGDAVSHRGFLWGPDAMSALLHEVRIVERDNFTDHLVYHKDM